MMTKRQITRADILDMAIYAERRDEQRANLVSIKRHRRMAVGPYATFYFENYDTMLYQIHEMLRIERGGEAQIADELAAYNPLVPNGRELVATVMLEITDEERRRKVLAGLGGIEDTGFLRIGDTKIAARPEADVDRTSASGKASAVQFFHFPLSAEDVAAFKQHGTEIVLGFDHPNYSHMAVMPQATKAALAEDLD
ncbi:MAG: DUF3501 family protein [Alphaproteobacteria bacterium]